MFYMMSQNAVLRKGTKDFMNQGLDKQIIIAAVRRHLPAILLSMIVGMLLAFAISNYMIDKKYESKAQVFISNVDTSTYQKVTTSDLSASRSMANTYRYILSSGRAVQMLRAELAADPDFDMAYLDSFKATMSVVGDTEIIEIAVRCRNPVMSALICNKIVEISTVLISDIFDGGRCNSLGEARPEYNPVFPNVRNMMLLGALIGLLVSAAAIMLVYLLDNRVKDEADFASKIGVPVLGEVPSIYELESGKENYGYYADYKKQNG